PVLLSAGDLTGDGRDDLVVVTAGSRQAFVFLQDAAGNFGPPPAYQNEVGVSPSDVQLADVDSDGRLDIVVTNRYSSDVSILLNSGSTPFATALRFRAGTGLSGVDTLAGKLVVHSLDGSAGVVAGRFDEGKGIDLLVTNSGANTASLLPGT